MRLFAVVALIAFAALPSAGNKQQSQAAEHDGQPQVTAPNPVTVNVVQNSPPAPQNAEAAQAESHNWREWFWPPIWSNWALILVAGFAAAAAFGTLSQIKKQSASTEKAANAARDNALAVINAERARILVHVKWPRDFASYVESVSWGESSYNLFVSVVCRNVGRSVGWIGETHIGLLVAETIPPEVGLSVTTLVEDDVFRPILADETIESSELEITSPVSPVPGKQVFVYGRVDYKDIFEQDRFTTFGYRLMKDRRRFERVTLPAYNKHT
jgi:hypothetical protein